MENEQINETPPARKPQKKKAKRAAVAKPAPSGFEGITPADCPIACDVARCVISGRAICAHPHKGGLQAALMNPDSIRRYNQAKRVLGKRKLDIAADQ